MNNARTEADLKPLDDAKATLAKVAAAATKAHDELAKREADLAALEEESGTRLFNARLATDADAETKIAAEIAAAKQTVETQRRIAAAAKAAIQSAQRDVWAAEAAELREDVRLRWPKVRNRIDETAKVLDELADVEGCRFWPGPQPLPSGACPEGSMMRTATGRLMADIADLERRATVLETQAGLTPQNSIMAAVLPSAAWHFGSMGILVTRPLVVHGSQLDDASAALAGREIPETPEPTAAEIAAARGNPSTWRG